MHVYIVCVYIYVCMYVICTYVWTVLALSLNFCCCRSSNIPPPSASPILPKPPQGNRRRVNKAGSTSSQSSSFTASFEAESTTVSSTTTTTTTTAAAATTTITVITPPTQESDDNLPVPTKRRTTMSSDATISQSNHENTPPVSTSVSFPLDKTADDSAPKKPVPVPRRNTIDRNLMASSPLALTSMRSPNTSTTSLPSIDVKEENTGVKVQQQQQPHKESSSALSSSSSLSTIGSVGSALQSKESTSNNSVVIPIALAIQETVNASFIGKTYGICIVFTSNYYCDYVPCCITAIQNMYTTMYARHVYSIKHVY